MADAARFPRLAPPFAIVGACAGWLSAGFLANPLLAQLERAKQPLVALIAGTLAAGAGALLRHWCAGRRYGYELAAPNPNARLASDVWWRHLGVMLATGAITGAWIGAMFNADEALRGGAGGIVCALVFVPVGFAVLGAARRAQRARLGSIVASADRRAVWSILATALGATTFEGSIDWPFAQKPIAAVAMLAMALGIVAVVLAVDMRAERAFRAVVRDLEERLGSSDDIERVDLGIGEELSARLERSVSPYRGADRTLALVHGSPVAARAALNRAVARGWWSLGLLCAVVGLHFAANADGARNGFAGLVHALPKCFLIR